MREAAANVHLAERSSFNPIRDAFSHREPSGEVLGQNNKFQAGDQLLRAFYLLFRTVSLPGLVVTSLCTEYSPLVVRC